MYGEPGFERYSCLSQAPCKPWLPDRLADMLQLGSSAKEPVMLMQPFMAGTAALDAAASARYPTVTS